MSYRYIDNAFRALSFDAWRVRFTEICLLDILEECYRRQP